MQDQNEALGETDSEVFYCDSLSSAKRACIYIFILVYVLMVVCIVVYGVSKQDTDFASSVKRSLGESDSGVCLLVLSSTNRAEKSLTSSS